MSQTRWHEVFRTSYPKHWAKAAESYEETPYNRFLLNLLLGRVFRGARVLDCGIGTGAPIGTALSSQDIGLFGVDLSEELLSQCRLVLADRAKRHLVVGAIEQLPYADSSFDLVYCLSTSWFLFDQRLAVAEMARTLSKDGVLVLDTINMWHPRQLFAFLRAAALASVRNTKRLLFGQPRVYFVPWRPQSPRGMSASLRGVGLDVKTRLGFFFLQSPVRKPGRPVKEVVPLRIALLGAKVVFVCTKSVSDHE